MTHHAEKYEELRQAFLQACADYDNSDFRLLIEGAAAAEQACMDSGLYDVPCYTEWPFGPWRRCAVLVPCTGDMAEAYAKLKELSANAWVWLPESLSEAVAKWVPEKELLYLDRAYKAWLWLLGVRYFLMNQHDEPRDLPDPGPACAHIDPFIASERLIREWGLNQELPMLPEWVGGKAKKGSHEEQPNTNSPNTRTKRSTAKGDARAKIIAALSLHHKYQDGSCLNQEPIGVRKLQRDAGVASSSVSDFFKKKFQGHAKYKVVCRDAGRLAESLKVLNGEFSPQCLYGRNPPQEGGRDRDD